MRVIFFTLGNLNHPSSRYRGYFFAKELKKLGIKTEVWPSIALTQKNILLKVAQNGLNLIKRFVELFKIKKDDIVYVQKAIYSHGIPLFFLFYKNILKKKIIFDFDDAIFLSQPFRVNLMLKKSDVVIVGNSYLARYAKHYNKNVFIIPTSVNIEYVKRIKRTKKRNKIIIGWIGSFSTLKYLYLLVKPFEQLGKMYNIEFNIVGPIAEDYKKRILKFRNIKFNFIKWSRENEWQEIGKFDIGVMPLPNTKWEKGKCGLKALQYMAMAVPTVCSAVGENKNIIKDGKNGFLCKSEKDWIVKLSLLIESEKLRKKLGKIGRKTVEKKYSLEKNTKKLIRIIDNLLVKSL